jgi:hypothetical protein
VIKTALADSGKIDQVTPQWHLLCGVIVLLFAHLAFFGQTSQITAVDETLLVVDDAPEMEVVAVGKSVIIKGRAKSVLTIGGNLLVEGQVEGDVGVLGGTLTQREQAFIGGDIIVFGGTYRSDSPDPRRGEGKQTVMFGMFEEEIRSFTENPSQILSPDISLKFVAQRLFSVLFWFIVTLGLTTLAPGAVSRAIARFQLSTTKIVAIGFSAFMLMLLSIVAGLALLPSYVNAVFGLMVSVLLILAYVFGRVTLQVSAGKLIQKYLFPENNRSESLAILIGVLFWTFLLSLPFIWMLGVFALFWAGIGLVLTARAPHGWQKS